MIEEKKKKPEKSEKYMEKLENRGSVKCLIEISMFSI